MHITCDSVNSKKVLQSSENHIIKKYDQETFIILAEQNWY